MSCQFMSAKIIENGIEGENGIKSRPQESNLDPKSKFIVIEN